MSETWKPVPGFEGHYEVSDLGRVRSAKGVRAIGWRKDGYGQVPLYRDGVQHSRLVHHLVLEAFVGPRPYAEYHACHNDGDKRNNALTNLRWDTASGNNADKKLHGTQLAGESAPLAKLSAADVRSIRARRGEPQTRLAQEFGCTFSNISAIQLGKSWRHV